MTLEKGEPIASGIQVINNTKYLLVYKIDFKDGNFIVTITEGASAG